MIPEVRAAAGKAAGVREDLERLLARKTRPGEDLWLQRASEVIPREEEGEEEAPETPDDESTVEELATQVLNGLSAEVETLSATTREGLRTLGAVLETITEERAPRYLQELPEACARLAAEHEEEHPNERAFAVLDEREPQVKVLRDADRQLETSYAFEAYRGAAGTT